MGPGLVAFVAKRLALSILVLELATIVSFGLVATSGDPLARYRADPHLSAESIARMERRLHLDRPLPERYVIWLGGLARGDLGRTIDDRDVRAILGRGAGVTLRLVGPVMVLAVAMALAVGSISAARPHSWVDHAGTVFAFVLLSMPAFWLGWLIREGAIRLNDLVGFRLLFFAGERTPTSAPGALSMLSDRLQHLVLPAGTLAMLAAAGWSRFLRSSMLDSLGTDYVRTARAKGLPERQVVGRHALRTSLGPLTSMVALTFAGFIGGAVVIEKVFSWHGLGQVLLDALDDRDTNLVSGWLLISAVAVVGMNLVADVLGAVLDPRTRYD